MSSKSKGIEYSFVESWSGWDEQDVGDFYFYDVKLREDVFGKEFIEKYKDQELDLGLWTGQSLIEVYLSRGDSDEPIFKSKIKAVFEEE